MNSRVYSSLRAADIEDRFLRREVKRKPENLTDDEELILTIPV